MIPIPLLLGAGVLVTAAAAMWANAEEPGSGNAMKDAFGRLERGEFKALPESYGGVPGVIGTAAALQAFLARLPGETPKELYNNSVRFVTHYLGNFKALRNQGKFSSQYDQFRTAVRADGGYGTTARREAAKGVQLIESVSGKTVSAEDRRALDALASFQAKMILAGRDN